MGSKIRNAKALLLVDLNGSGDQILEYYFDTLRCSTTATTTTIATTITTTTTTYYLLPTTYY